VDSGHHHDQISDLKIDNSHWGQVIIIRIAILIRFHGAPLLQIQPQTEKLSCNNEPDFMLFALALQIISV